MRSASPTMRLPLGTTAGASSLPAIPVGANVADTPTDVSNPFSTVAAAAAAGTAVGGLVIAPPRKPWEASTRRSSNTRHSSSPALGSNQTPAQVGGLPGRSCVTRTITPPSASGTGRGRTIPVAIAASADGRTLVAGSAEARARKRLQLRLRAVLEAEVTHRRELRAHLGAAFVVARQAAAAAAHGRASGGGGRMGGEGRSTGAGESSSEMDVTEATVRRLADLNVALTEAEVFFAPGAGLYRFFSSLICRVRIV